MWRRLPAKNLGFAPVPEQSRQMLASRLRPSHKFLRDLFARIWWLRDRPIYNRCTPGLPLRIASRRRAPRRRRAASFITAAKTSGGLGARRQETPDPYWAWNLRSAPLAGPPRSSGMARRSSCGSRRTAVGQTLVELVPIAERRRCRIWVRLGRVECPYRKQIGLPLLVGLGCIGGRQLSPCLLRNKPSLVPLRLHARPLPLRFRRKTRG